MNALKWRRVGQAGGVTRATRGGGLGNGFADEKRPDWADPGVRANDDYVQPPDGDESTPVWPAPTTLKELIEQVAAGRPKDDETMALYKQFKWAFPHSMAELQQQIESGRPRDAETLKLLDDFTQPPPPPPFPVAYVPPPPPPTTAAGRPKTPPAPVVNSSAQTLRFPWFGLMYIGIAGVVYSMSVSAELAIASAGLALYAGQKEFNW